MTTVTVVPVPGRLIFMPDRGFTPVPDEGVTVNRFDPFYAKALRDGDLQIVDASKAPSLTVKSAQAPVAPAVERPEQQTSAPTLSELADVRSAKRDKSPLLPASETSKRG